MFSTLQACISCFLSAIVVHYMYSLQVGGLFLKIAFFFQKLLNKKSILVYPLGFLLIFIAFFLIECTGYLLLQPEGYTALGFGALWSLLLTCFIFCLPKLAGRIVFGILYFFMLLWTLAQTGYFLVFGNMMWLSTMGYAGEGAVFLGDVISSFPFLWWFGLIFMLALGVGIIWFFPPSPKKLLWRIPCVLGIAISVLYLSMIPEYIFRRDKTIWGTHSEYGQSSSYRAAYKTMFDAKRLYDMTGIYQMVMRDIWVNQLYPYTPAYRNVLQTQTTRLDEYFARRGEHESNDMTGIFAGKNVVMVLMESMDDWMITSEDTPTIIKMMNEGINFTNFYTPGFGSARTLNSEFCMNTGIYLPTTGSYVFDYVTNSYKQSIASQMTANGYSSYVFHYNTPTFYSRGVFEPAMGYEEYVCYSDYESDKNRLYDDALLFDLPKVKDIFFRDGQTFNTIITRSAHLSYKYNEVLSHYALKQYPDYRGLYGSEEEDCARVKAKLVDDMFARLLQELEAAGQLDNTVIIAMTDHYTYGYKNMDELYALSGVENTLLLEKTPCFIWSANGPQMEITKELNTSDFLPTVLNLLGIDSPYHYLGQDAFSSDYKGYVLFPDGSWISDGVAYKNGKIIMNVQGRHVSDEEIQKMAVLSEEYRNVSNMLLTCNYYK